MYITIRKTDDQGKINAWSRALKVGALGQARELDGVRKEVGGEFRVEGHVCNHGWFISTYGKSHQNTVK